jgi:sugar phosphate isomerase/epimerase
MDRRSFLLQSLSTALLSGTAYSALAADNRYRQQIGLQLYTLRNPLAKDAKATLQAVAAAGYKQVEMYGFPQSQAQIDAARDAGLAMHSSHIEWDCVVNPKDSQRSEFASMLEKAKEIGLSHLVVPYLMPNNRKTLDDYRKVAENANHAAAMAKKVGIQLSYHNHNFEFAPIEGGKSGFDIFIEEFSADMKFELDVFWVVAAGLDPIKLMEKLKGRVTQLHLKDLKADVKTPTFQTDVPQDAFKELGQGTIAMAPIIEAAAAAGVEHCHVEQDQSPDPLASVKQSIGYLKTL